MNKICLRSAYVILFVLTIYSFNAIGATYFEVPLSSILNLSVLILFAFYWTQRKADMRSQKEIVRGIIEEIQFAIKEVFMYQIKDENDIKKILVAQRGVFNRIEALEKASEELKFDADLKLVEDKFTCYWEYISEHMQDIKSLNNENAEIDLVNILSLMENKLEMIVMMLYFDKSSVKKVS